MHFEKTLKMQQTRSNQREKISARLNAMKGIPSFV